MDGVLVDSCILLDLFTDDRRWGNWSESILERYGRTKALYVNSIIYAEVSIGFSTIDKVDAALSGVGVTVLPIPKEALFLAGKIFLQYRKNRGTKYSPLPDFFIGAHAYVAGAELITRDLTRYSTYFPDLKLIHPEIE